MATGISRAQELLGDTKCDLCDTYKQVIWKCQNCQEVLCEQCKKSHLRSKLSKNHIVTEITGESSDDSQHSRVFCPDHNNEALQMFCTTCDCLICLDCITGKHNKHQCIKLGDILLQKQEELEAAFDEIKNVKIPSLEQTIDSITEIQGDYKQKIDCLLTEIKSKGEELKQEIERIQRKLTDEVMKKATQDQKQLSETKEKCENELSVIKTYLKEHEEKVHKLTDIDIILKTGDIKEALSQLTHGSKLPKVGTPNFHSPRIRVSSLEEMYGQLLSDEEESPRVTSRTTSTMLTASTAERELTLQGTQTADIASSFKYGEPVRRMRMLNQDEAWVSGVRGVLKLVDQRGRTVNSLPTKLDISDMAITSTGDLLVTVRGRNDVKQVITGSGDVFTFANMTPYNTYGLHITEKGDVIVGSCHYDHNDRWTSKITRLSPKGKIRHEHTAHRQFYGLKRITEKDFYLRFPYRITENKNEDIVIIDFWETVKVIDRKGYHRFTYTGPKQTKRFQPRDIVCNQNEEILIADGNNNNNNNNNIQLLNKDGVFMRYILTQQEGLSFPTALSTDTNGKLWIGCNNGQVLVVKYLV